MTTLVRMVRQVNEITLGCNMSEAKKPPVRSLETQEAILKATRGATLKVLADEKLKQEKGITGRDGYTCRKPSRLPLLSSRD
ncbi:hypothetical protein A1D31_35410 [Bradyrhizobium liaoningense]|nr:hypothetical protein A1D31_35410 [Bradyrhizobium liaoningense]